MSSCCVFCLVQLIQLFVLWLTFVKHLQKLPDKDFKSKDIGLYHLILHSIVL